MVWGTKWRANGLVLDVNEQQTRGAGQGLVATWDSETREARSTRHDRSRFVPPSSHHRRGASKLEGTRVALPTKLLSKHVSLRFEYILIDTTCTTCVSTSGSTMCISTILSHQEQALGSAWPTDPAPQRIFQFIRYALAQHRLQIRGTPCRFGRLVGGEHFSELHDEARHRLAEAEPAITLRRTWDVCCVVSVVPHGSPLHIRVFIFPERR